MKYILTALLICSSVSLFGQYTVVNIKPRREIDSIRSHSHFVTRKLSDSVWLGSEYDLNDTLMNVGTYKDKDLYIAEGKFKFYTLEYAEKRISFNYTTHRSDTIFVPNTNYLTTVGYFKNGKKTGLWYKYDHLGKITSTSTYVNDMLNGEYKSYIDGFVHIEGNYINNIREGNWNMVDRNGEVYNTEIYRHGEIVRTLSHVFEKKFKMVQTGGEAKYNFIKYLNDKLKNEKFDKVNDQKVLYTIIVDTDGKLIEPSVIRSIGRENDIKIIDAILSAPNWQPGYMNNKLVKLSVGLSFEVSISDDGRIHLSYWRG